ncbi:cytochrome b562 [Mannheimia indoligenes]|uniref:Cytochrome b562 n=1 Tax=Mannheimia indoligenes TaxID=3103145 RepID=A0ABU7ZFS7_9PAST
MLKLKTLFVAATLGVAAISAQAGLKDDMQGILGAVKEMAASTTSEQYIKAADAFVANAASAQNTLPIDFNTNDAKAVEGYKKGLQDVIDVANEGKKLAAEGKLAEAKALLAKLEELKNHNHKLYK